MELFYEPKNAVVGDVIPFYDKGCFKPFYLKGNRGYFGDDSTSGWTMLTTQDHLHFTETPTGIRGEQVLCCWWMKCIISFTALLSKIQNGKR